MPLEHQMKNGLLYVEHGHESPADQEYAKLIEQQRVHGKELTFDYNNTRPSDIRAKENIMRQILGGIGKDFFIESPVHFSYGCNTYIGENFYANFNLTIVDDWEVHIGDNVMIAPNVTISVTGHPVHGEFRRKGCQFSLPVNIGNDVWIGSNVVILPGVTVGDNVVIGAGSVVTKNIPSNSLAFGVPCKVQREITDYDKEYYLKGVKVNDDWDK